MPITPAHAAAVLPLRRFGLPATTLVVASMVPDLPLFVRWPGAYHLTHSLAGVLTVDLGLTVLVVAVWSGFVREAVIGLAPRWVRSRVRGGSSPAPLGAAFVVAAWLGAGTHVGWDAFTHHGRWGADHVAWLRGVHAGMPGYAWAQYVSGLVGGLVVTLAAVRHLRRLPPTHVVEELGAAALFLPSALVLASGVAVATAVHRAVTLEAGVRSTTYWAVINGGTTLCLAVAALCLAWPLVVRRTAGRSVAAAVDGPR